MGRPARSDSGIHRDRGGWRVYAYVGGKTISRRFPSDTPRETMESWRLRQRADELVTPPDEPATTPAPDADTLAADVERYLALVGAMTTLATRTQHLADWVAVLDGTRRKRADVTQLEIAEALSVWQRTRGYSASTLNHRRGALANLYRRLDPAGPNPARATPKYREPQPEPRGLSLQVVQAILAQLRPRDVKGRGTAPSRTAAQLLVMATTGFPPATIARLRPEHLVHIDAGIVLRPGRRKGRGTATERHPVTAQGAGALRLWAALDAWGDVPSSTRLIVWRRAVARVRALHPEWHIPADVRPYDLRHSVGDAVYEAVGDLSIVQAVLGHADIRTTQRYAAGAIQRREAVAVDAVTKAWEAASVGRNLPTEPTQP